MPLLCWWVVPGNELEAIGGERMQNTDRDQISFEDLAKEHYSSENTEEYNAFVEKFKPKRTTDDCFTPPNIYEAVREFVFEEYDIPEGIRVLRPFYPGGDYESEDYSEDCIVIDNPPFSILARIIRFYMERGVKFFLFAPGKTLFSYGAIDGVNFVVVGTSGVTFDNGAKVNLGFVTNFGKDKIYCCPRLHDRIEAIDMENQRALTKSVPKYDYPHNVVNAVRLGYLSEHGIELRIKAQDARFIRQMDAQRKQGKNVYGCGFLLSEKAAEKVAAERAAAERAANENANAIVWELSEREMEIIAGLG